MSERIVTIVPCGEGQATYTFGEESKWGARRESE